MSNTTVTFRGKATPEVTGARYFKTALTTTIPGTLQVLITDTVGVSAEVWLMQLDATSMRSGIVYLVLDGVTIASKRTVSGSPNATFYFSPYHAALSGQVIEVKYLSHSWNPASDVEVYLQGRLL